jgi:hypothetical protein
MVVKGNGPDITASGAAGTENPIEVKGGNEFHHNTEDAGKNQKVVQAPGQAEGQKTDNHERTQDRETKGCEGEQAHRGITLITASGTIHFGQKFHCVFSVRDESLFKV